MSATAIVILVVVVIVVAVLLAVVGQRELRRRRLREQFGPEYDRVVQDADNRRIGEQELTDRQRRHAELPIRPLSTPARDRYSALWIGVQERFVDEPVDAVGEADELVVAVMSERGYPTDGYRQQLADLSVEHANVLENYRLAHDLSEQTRDGAATTEDLRQAMVHYRSLFEALLGSPVRAESGPAEGTRAAQATATPAGVNQALADEGMVDEARVDEARVDEARVDEARVDEARVDGVGASGAGVNQAWVDEARVDPARANQARTETPADQPRADGSIADRAPADEAPANQARTQPGRRR